MNLKNYSIGQLAKKSGCKVQTIRYYENINLIPEPMRSEGNQRIYSRDDLDRLIFVRHSRALGFSIEDIRQLIYLTEDSKKSCDTVDKITSLHLQEVNNRITKLTALKNELERMIKRCKGGKIDDCQIIAVLANHELCVVDDHENPA